MATEWTQPGIEALAEDDGHGDTCGPIIMLDYLHVANGQTLDYGATDALRARLIADGLMGTTGGMTLGQIVQAMQDYYGIPTRKYVGWASAATVLPQLEQDLAPALYAHELVALETHNAAALPNNQAGIANHFILAAGVDATGTRFLICNGDTLAALVGGRTNPVQAAVWVTWQDLVNAQISSYAIWPAVEVPMIDVSQVAPWGFSANADGTWSCAGHTIGHGILDFYRAFPGGTYNGFSAFGQPRSDEIAVKEPAAAGRPQPVFQIFERVVVVYDPDRVVDGPPGAVGDLYLWHLDAPQVLAVIAPPPPPPPPAPVPEPVPADPVAVAAKEALANLKTLLAELP